MLKKSIPLLSIFGLLIFTAPKNLNAQNAAGQLHPDDKQAEASRIVSKLITTANYKSITLNDSISALIYDRYIKSLDINHNYLLAADVDEFDKLKYKLDDNIKAGELAGAFGIFNVYQKRFKERWTYALSLLDKNTDLNKKETYVYDRRDLPFIKTQQEMDENWRKRVKYDLLNLSVVVADMDKNKQTLKKRYQSLLDQAEKMTGQDVFQIFMGAFTNSVDPHTNYFNPFYAQQFNIQMARSLEGIGATLGIEDEYVTISALTAGGPAAKSKQVGINDRILAVAQGKDGEFEDIVGWRLENAVSVIRGQKGSVVRLKLLPKGKSATDEPTIVDIVRDKVILEEQSAKKEIRTYNTNGKTTKIGVITIPSFYMDFKAYEAGNQNYKSTTRDVKLILDTLKAMKVDGVMIDLRQDGGGSLTEAIALTGLFIKSGPVVQVRNTRGQVQVDQDRDTSVTYAGPLAVVVDRYSASASEIFAAAIQDYGRGLILGSQTYGKGTVQTQLSLDRAVANTNEDSAADSPEGNKFGQLNLTMAKFYRITGSSTQHKGVTPDIDLPSLIQASKYGEDTEPSALPWDTIAKTDYKPVGSFDNIIPSLTKLHNERAKSSPAYQYFTDMIAYLNRNEMVKNISLTETDFKKQRETNEAAARNRDNLIRKAMGLPTLKKGETNGKKDDLDFTKREAGQILTDYILSNK
ncbi:carboxy terminal-processing peptidase [Mucilaginibacter sp.]|uniref:carboxy terminal-processing peptidase n=1 Tax=Mucilaginibacter sp. TaxID=1882438 RepID=UPI002ED16193